MRKLKVTVEKFYFLIILILINFNSNIEIYMLSDSSFPNDNNSDNSGILLILICFICASIFLFLQFKNLPSNLNDVEKPIKYATLKDITPKSLPDVLPNVSPNIPPQITFFIAFFFYYSLGLTIYVCYLNNLFGCKNFLDNFKKKILMYVFINYPMIYKYWNYIGIFIYLICVIILYYV